MDAKLCACSERQIKTACISCEFLGQLFGTDQALASHCTLLVDQTKNICILFSPVLFRVESQMDFNTEISCFNHEAKVTTLSQEGVSATMAHHTLHSASMPEIWHGL